MKICLVNYRYFVSGGPERYMFGVTKLLEDLGHEVVPFSVRYRQNEPSPWSGYFVEPIGRDDEVTFRQTSWRLGAVVRGVERAFYSRDVYQAVSRLVEVTRPDVAFVLNYLKKLSPSVLAAFNDAGIPIVNRFSDFALICPQAHLVRDGRICEECLGGSLWPSVRYRCVQGSLPASAINALAMTYARRRRYLRRHRGVRRAERGHEGEDDRGGPARRRNCTTSPPSCSRPMDAPLPSAATGSVTWDVSRRPRAFTSSSRPSGDCDKAGLTAISSSRWPAKTTRLRAPH